MIDDFERSRSRKRSQYHRPSYSSKFNIITEDNLNNSKMQINEKLISVISQNLLNNINNTNTNTSQTSLNNNTNDKNLNTTTSNRSSNANKKTNMTENKTSSLKEKDKESIKEKLSSNNKKNGTFEAGHLPRFTSHDTNILFNGKPVKKTEEELFLDRQYNTIDFFLKSISDKNKAIKQLHESKESNFSSSNLGFMSNAKSISVKSEEKITKINLQYIMENDRLFMKRDSPCIILSDKINIENCENKLDLLIKIMEEYKDIIMEKTFCKNFQDRIILSIYISLSQVSFKLFQNMENNKKINHIRKYICGLTNNIKYDLKNNPNFTLSSINQKFIEIMDIKNQNQNQINSDENQKNSNENSINKNNDSTINFSSMSNSKKSSSISNNNIRDNYKSLYDDEEEEIIYENFEDFKESDKDYLYTNNNIYFESDNIPKENNNIANNLENNNYNKHSTNNVTNGIASKISKNRFRRNASHKIAFDKGNKNSNILAYSTTGAINFKQKDYDFQVIDVNGNENIYDSDDSIDSEEGCYEMHDNHKNDLPKLLFYEEHVRDKDKRKINKMNHIEIKPNPRILIEKARIKELNDKAFNNIVTIINKDASLLPSHELNLNPFEIEDFINEREKRQKNPINKDGIKPIEKNKKEELKINDEDKNNSLNNSFFTHIYSRSGSFFQNNNDEDDDDENNSNNKILLFENEDEES